MKKIILLICYIACLINATAQAPLNDNCTGAILLTVSPNGDCSNAVTGSTTNATQSSPGCAGNADDDVWYKFVATGTKQNIKIMGGTSSVDLAFEVYSGDCNNLTLLACINNSIPSFTSSNDQEFKDLSNLTIGATYYVKLYNIAAGSLSAFTICVNNVSVQNDFCADATVLAVNPSGFCAASVTGSNINATQSLRICISTPRNDVWYKFTATASLHVIKVTGITLADPAFDLYSTNTCPDQTGVINCSSIDSYKDFSTTNIESFTATDLVIGTVYYIRVTNTSFVPAGSFSICITTPTIPNDNCTTAIQVPVNTSRNCILTTAGSTSGALMSPTIFGGCALGNPDDDVWYKFTATNTSERITVTPTGAEGTAIYNPVFSLYQGTCGSLSTINCRRATILRNYDKPLYDVFTNLVIGNTYYIQIFSTGYHAGDGDFNLCISDEFIPVNFDCNTATLLTPTLNNTLNFTAGSTSYGILNEQQECSQNAVEYPTSVWYQFVANSNFNRVRISPNGNKKNIKTQIYQGFCQVGFPTQCYNDSVISLNNFGNIVGSTFYIRVHSRNTVTDNDFKIAVYTNSLKNDECANAATLFVDSTSSGPSKFYTTLQTTQSLPACSGNAVANDIWFTFTAGTKPINIAVDYKNIRPQIEIFSGTCGSLTSIKCETSDNIVTLQSLVNGNQYFVRVYGFVSSTPLEFFIKAYETAISKSNTSIDTTCLLQNLVVNPSFETYTTCPVNVTLNVPAGTQLIPAWTLPTKGSSDYFNSCFTTLFSRVRVPNNGGAFDKQYPRSGKGFAGIYTYAVVGSTLGSNFVDIVYREYLQGTLTMPMVVGKKYLISYWINLAEFSRAASNKLGVYFSSNLTTVDTFSNLILTPQVVSPQSQFFTDKENWVNVSSIYTATAAANYFIIGNFANDINTQLVPSEVGRLRDGFNDPFIPNGYNCYLNIDDVTISEINETAAPQCNLGTLPLTLTDFNAQKQNDKVNLTWRTVYEADVNHFEVERSVNGNNDFIKIASVAAAGNSSTIKDYNTSDNAPINGNNFYRLKIIDNDGKFKYTDIRLVRFDKASFLSIYPNPFTDEIKIVNTYKNAKYILYDAVGRKVTEEVLRLGTNAITSKNFAKGIYALSIIQNGSIIKTEKLIKK